MHLWTRLNQSKTSLSKIAAWTAAFLFSALFFVNAKADVTGHLTPDTYALVYWSVGEKGFDFPFERMADQLCVKGYRVIDKTYKLQNPVVGRSKWLIACKEAKEYND